MATKTATKTNRNAKAASKAITTKATKKNATVAKPTAKDSKPAEKKMSQIEAAGRCTIQIKGPHELHCDGGSDASPRLVEYAWWGYA